MSRALSLAVTWVRFAVGGLLVAAAVPKIVDPAGFASAVAAYEWGGSWWVAGALFLPWLELFTAVTMLAVPALRRGAWLLGVLLFAMFAVAVASAAVRGLSVQCGCLPGLSQLPVGWPHVFVDLGLAAVCAAGLVLEEIRCPARFRPRAGSAEG